MFSQRGLKNFRNIVTEDKIKTMVKLILEVFLLFVSFHCGFKMSPTVVSHHADSHEVDTENVHKNLTKLKSYAQTTTKAF